MQGTQGLIWASVLLIVTYLVAARRKLSATLSTFSGLGDVLRQSNDAEGQDILNVKYFGPQSGAVGTPGQVLGINTTNEMRWLTPVGILTPGLFDVLTNSEDAGALDITNLRQLTLGNPSSAGAKVGILAEPIVSTNSTAVGIDVEQVAGSTGAVGVHVQETRAVSNTARGVFVEDTIA